MGNIGEYVQVRGLPIFRQGFESYHHRQSKLTDFDKKSVSFHFQLAAELHRAGIFDIIQPERSDWRFVMKWQKKQYRPIAGQTWYEKVLDWITREENFKWLITGIGLYVVLMLLGTYISANILNQKDVADAFFKVWCAVFPVVLAMVLLNPLSTIWDFYSEKKFREMIKNYLAAHNRCTYDELVAYCMPIKIHLGINSAIEKCSNAMNLYGKMTVTVCLRTKIERNGENNGLRNGA